MESVEGQQSGCQTAKQTSRCTKDHHHTPETSHHSRLLTFVGSHALHWIPTAAMLARAEAMQSHTKLGDPGLASTATDATHNLVPDGEQLPEMCFAPQPPPSPTVQHNSSLMSTQPSEHERQTNDIHRHVTEGTSNLTSEADQASEASRLNVLDASVGATDWDIVRQACEDPASPITLVRGFINATQLDTSHFNLDTLEVTAGHLFIETRSQLYDAKQPSHAVDARGQQTWACHSVPGTVKMSSYLSRMRQHLDTTSSSIGVVAEGADFPQHKAAAPSPPQVACAQGLSMEDADVTDGSHVESVLFGTNIDLMDKAAFEQQLEALKAALPDFVSPSSPQSALNALGVPIPGMNCVQLYLKTQGCRTPGHRENLNFVSANINLGPAPCEWFFVEEKYSEQLREALASRSLDMVVDSWWPSCDQLNAAGIPCHRFVQEAGDLVYVNVGTIHWVQALGVCRNLAWNLGPCTPHQLSSAWACFEDNHRKKFLSVVPMKRLFFRLAKDWAPLLTKDTKAIVIQRLREIVKSASLDLRNIRDKSVKVTKTQLESHEQSAYCSFCRAELFVYGLAQPRQSQRQRSQLACLSCAKHRGLRSFVCCQFVTLAELKKAIQTCKAASYDPAFSPKFDMNTDAAQPRRPFVWAETKVSAMMPASSVLHPRQKRRKVDSKVASSETSGQLDTVRVDPDAAAVARSKDSEVEASNMPFKCCKCAKGFRTLRQLTGHFATHSSEPLVA